MQLFKRVFDFYINSSIHVSLAVVALGWVTCLSLDINVNYELLAFLFFSTVTGYNFVKYAEIAGLHHRSLAKSLKSIQVFSVFCGIGMIVTAFWLPLEVWVACGILGLITLLYAVPFFLPATSTDNNKGNLRSISGVKIYIIGLVWAGVTVLLPVLEHGLSMHWDVWVLFTQHFLFVIALMIPFEIRDTSYDLASLRTLPQVVGIKKAKIIGVIWLFLFLILDFLKYDLSMPMLTTHLIIVAVVVVCITLSRKRTSAKSYFTSFWIEGIPLLWLSLALLFNYLLD
ncbi:hypothetical protein JM84_1113 [Dokdonia sp. Hel_I_63]|uniref:hypothetical protein n=1 Tax=Dokdonia sp. Hel_I_63 TaxID=1249996 RepID=UPI001199B454|nr:hypothetical protein [Dokdonia sp. Hel_I_63]TVZ22223.1 hypothetical protein JM84_1113 [Dokdonia sp. Hel_I_63]